VRAGAPVTTFGWIVVSGVAMSGLALVGSATLLLSEARLRQTLLPLVAFAAGTLLGGAFFHMLPGALAQGRPLQSVFLWTAVGFTTFFALEQFLHWHHCHRAARSEGRPLTYLILLGDGLHNFLGGLAVAGAFIADVRLGLGAWLAAAAHEIPQELGDFGVLVHGGWGRRKALAFNLLSGLTFLAGGLVAYSASRTIDVTFLLPLAAGNFLYIAASDLVPEVNRDHGLRGNIVIFMALTAGIALLYWLQIALGRDR
jgi:zinc and cadmium transporter